VWQREIAAQENSILFSPKKISNPLNLKINFFAGVEVVQPQHTQLADVALPELDGAGGGGGHVRQPSDAAGAVAAAGGALAAEQTSRAAHDILAAAKTVNAPCADAAVTIYMFFW
jgi:hypothetical protein